MRNAGVIVAIVVLVIFIGVITHTLKRNRYKIHNESGEGGESDQVTRLELFCPKGRRL